MNLNEIAQNLARFRREVQTDRHTRNSCLHASVILTKKWCPKHQLLWT